MDWQMLGLSSPLWAMLGAMIYDHLTFKPAPKKHTILHH